MGMSLSIMDELFASRHAELAINRRRTLMIENIRHFWHFEENKNVEEDENDDEA